MTHSKLADRIWTTARPIGWLLATAAIAAPAIAMRLTTEVQWTPADFVAAATLLFGGGLACEAFAVWVKTGWVRIAFSLTVMALVALAWGVAKG